MRAMGRGGGRGGGAGPSTDTVCDAHGVITDEICIFTDLDCKMGVGCWAIVLVLVALGNAIGADIELVAVSGPLCVAGGWVVRGGCGSSGVRWGDRTGGVGEGRRELWMKRRGAVWMVREQSYRIGIRRRLLLWFWSWVGVEAGGRGWGRVEEREGEHPAAGVQRGRIGAWSEDGGAGEDGRVQPLMDDAGGDAIAALHGEERVFVAVVVGGRSVKNKLINTRYTPHMSMQYFHVPRGSPFAFTKNAILPAASVEQTAFILHRLYTKVEPSPQQYKPHQNGAGRVFQPLL